MKRILSFILTLIMILGMVQNGTSTVYAEPADATALELEKAFMDPASYEPLDTIPEGYTPINDAFDLYFVSGDLTGNYILMNDIDLTPYLAEGGDLYNAEGWIALGYSPVSSNCVQFTGTFDGNGHKIRGLTCNGPGAGLFYKIGETGTVKNLTIASGNIVGLPTGSWDYYGSIAQVNCGVIENCHNYASVSISTSQDSFFVGGIAGENYPKATIRNCSNYGTVSGVGGQKNASNYRDVIAACGGIVGYNCAGTIDKVWNRGNVSVSSSYVTSYTSPHLGGSKAGGIAGRMDTGNSDSSPLLQNAYNTGIISAVNAADNSNAFSEAGGLVGIQTAGQVTCCYNVGQVTATSVYSENNYAGGICGYQQASASVIAKCYYLNIIENGVGNNPTSSCVSLSDALMKKQQSFVGFDFDSIWSMGTGDYLYPVLTHTHVMTHVDAVEPTCTTDGNIEYWFCAKCNRYFADAEGNQEITIEDTVIPAGHLYEDVVIEPTCTADGYTKHVCSRCGSYYIDSYVAPLGHDIVTDEGVEPTCTEPGLTGGTHCSRCDYVVSGSEVIPALGHNPGTPVKENESAPTCTAPGSYDLVTYCTRCGVVLNTEHHEEPALGHSWGSWAVTTPATCTAAGTETRTCSRCGETETRTIAALGHDYQAVITPPTCTEQGYTTHTCSRCGNSYVDNYVGALGHAWDEGVIIQEPTETEPGLRRYTCTRCGATRDEVIPSPGHEHHYTAVVTPPTCTEQGYTTYTCSCGDSYVDDYVPALGHAFGGWTMTTPPTCEGAGAETRTCSRCGETESSPVPALGHDWGEPEYVWADDNSYITASRSCKREAGHMEMETVLTSSQIIKEPTYEEEGLTIFIAVFTNTAFQTQTKSTALPKLIRENPFVDVIEGKYYYNPVLWAYYHQPYQITGGTDATHFSPGKTCTREQVVSFLYAAYDKPEHHMTFNPFTDVKAGKYYYNAVMWAVENKITGGATETTFGIGKPCTREQVVTFLWKAAGAPAPKSTANPFTDVKAGKYYYNAVLWAVENGITGGATETTFGVGKPCTRAQVVTFLYKAVGEG